MTDGRHTVVLTQPQIDFMNLDCKYPAFVGGYGCVHSSTRIWTEHGLRRISEITSATRVVSWNERSQRFQLSLSGGSFPKGRANLYRVSTEQGGFVASGHHRIFSSDCKYLPVSDLLQKHLSSTSLFRSNLEFAPLLSSLDAPRYSKINEYYLESYANEARQYGQQFLLDRGSVLSSSPLTAYARRLSQCCDLFSFLRRGVQWVRKLKRTHHDLFSCLIYKIRSTLRMPSLESCVVSQTSASYFERTSVSHHKVQISDERLGVHRNIEKHSSDVHSFLVPSLIKKVTATEDSVYYDMQVLSTNNYVCEGGFIHHNSGKSEVMAIKAVTDALHSSTTLIGLYLPTYDLIKLITAPRIAEKLSMFGIRFRYNVQDHIFYTSSPQCGDFILRTMDNPSRIVGYETYRSHVDELDTLPLEKAKSVWQRIIARNRQRPEGIPDNQLKNGEVFNRVSAYSTPEGFNMVYHTWGHKPSENYKMVTAPTYSNPYLPKDYVEGLRETYPSTLIDAYIEGKFVNLTSGTVYNMFDRRLNGSNAVWDKREPVYIGMDFNVGKMAAIIHVKRNGKPIAVDEIIDAYDTPEIIDIIQERYQRCVIRVYPDASGGSRKSVNASKTDISLLQTAGFSVIAPKKNPPVKDRIIAMNKMFCASNGDRGYTVNVDKCPTYADNLEQQIWGSNGEPDKKADNDHTNDAGGYFISYDYPVIKPVVYLVTKFAM